MSIDSSLIIQFVTFIKYEIDTMSVISNPNKLIFFTSMGY
jgi:hypothetical protein